MTPAIHASRREAPPVRGVAWHGITRIALILHVATALGALAADAPARDLVVPGSVAEVRRSDDPVRLPVPVIEQARRRCGPAALQMVLSYYGAGEEAMSVAGSAYDPVLRGALITDLAIAARRAGFDAAVEALTPASLIALLEEGVPPIVLYQNGRPPFTVPHYGVVTGWDHSEGVFTLNDGSARPRSQRVGELVKRWTPAGAQALVVRRRLP